MVRHLRTGFFRACSLQLLWMMGACGSQSSLNESSESLSNSRVTGVEYVSALIRDLDFKPKSESRICFAVFAGPEGFPEDESKIALSGCKDVNDRIMSFLIEGLPPTTDGYAISLFQDMNGNGILDTRNLFGFRVPDEPFGFTRNPNLRGAPRYEDVRIDPIKNGEKVEVFMKKI